MRAKREEEAPLLLEAYELQKVSDREYHVETQQAAVAAHKAQWEADIVEKGRMAKVAEEHAKLAKSISVRRTQEFAALKAERAERVQEERAMKAAECIRNRKKCVCYIHMSQIVFPFFIVRHQTYYRFANN